MRSKRYLAASARRAGVPLQYLEDAVQDIEIGLWRRRRDDVLAVRAEAIDAARRYNRSRTGKQRNADKVLSELQHDVGREPSYAALELAEAISKVRRRDRAILATWLMGWKLWEIGAALGVSERRAGQLVMRARDAAMSSL